MGMGKSILIPMILISQACLAQELAATRKVGPVDFFQEDIALTVNDSFANVSGTYYFRNNTERDSKMPILFPFYIDASSAYPESIRAFVLNGSDSTHLDFRDTQNGIMLGIPLYPHLITIWHLDYRQRILGPKATYILTSTSAWGAPLEEATYSFIVPASFKDVKVWPETDTIIVKGDWHKYLARRTNFMPTKNMEIDWKSK